MAQTRDPAHRGAIVAHGPNVHAAPVPSRRRCKSKCDSSGVSLSLCLPRNCCVDPFAETARERLGTSENLRSSTAPGEQEYSEDGTGGEDGFEANALLTCRPDFC